MSEHKENERELAAVQAVGEEIRRKQAERPTCLTCVHCNYSEETLAQGMGECWRNPPMPVVVGPPDRFGRFPRQGIYAPMNLRANWCGRHETQLVVKPSALELRTFEKRT